MIISNTMNNLLYTRERVLFQAVTNSLYNWLIIYREIENIPILPVLLKMARKPFSVNMMPLSSIMSCQKG